MAQDLLQRAKEVTMVGRTESKLQSTSIAISSLSKHGDTPYVVLDSGDVASTPGLAEKLLAVQFDVDCLINKAGCSNCWTA